MRPDVYLKLVLTVIAIFLGIVAFRPVFAPAAAHAASTARCASIQFSEGVYEFESKNGGMTGRVAINLRTGNVYGFPTDGNVYPRNPAKGDTVVSDPVLLGRFNLDKVGQ